MMRHLSDSDLFSLLAEPEKEKAFVEIIDRYKKDLYRLSYFKTGSSPDSEEIVQDVFISLWNNREKITVGNSLAPYLFQSVKNRVISFYVNKKRKIPFSDLLDIKYEPAVLSVEEHIITHETENFLQEEIEKMPSTMKRIFHLSRYEHLSVKEIASVLSLSEQTVKNNISNALRILSKKLKKADQLIALLIFFKLI